MVMIASTAMWHCADLQTQVFRRACAHVFRHMFRHVFRHVCSDMCSDMCSDLRLDMCLDTCMAVMSMLGPHAI